MNAENTTCHPDKRSAILDSALRLLSTRGLHDTPMSLISKESGVSVGNIYHHFPSKDELIFELYREIKVNALQSMLQGFEEKNSYQDRFLHLWYWFIRYYIDHPAEVKFMQQIEHSPYQEENWSELFADSYKPLLMFFQDGIQEGMLKDLPLEILMEMVSATATALAKKHIDRNTTLTDEIIKATAQACWDMIKT